MTQTSQSTRAVLIVEDEPIVAMDLVFIIEDLGHRVVGPFRSVRETLERLGDSLPDLAVLDVNVADGQIFPVADQLMAANIPIVFCSAHLANSELAERYPASTTVIKPYSEQQVQIALRRGLDG